PVPEWAADNLDINLIDYACLQVLKVEGRQAAALQCRPLTAPVPTALDLTGFLISKATQDELLNAIGMTDVPSAGLVVGIVIGPDGTPVAGASVNDEAGSTVEYLSADRMTL